MRSGDGFTATRTRHRLANLRQIATPKHARAFGLVIPDETSNLCCARPFDRIVLQMMPRTDYAAANEGGHTGFQLAFDDDVIEEALEQLELPTHLDSGAAMRVLEIESGQVFARACESLAAQSVESDPRKLAEDILAFLVKRFSEPSRVYQTRANGRRRAFRQARDYFESHLADPLTLADVCRSIGVSRRCLTHAFPESVGVSPMAYLKLIRLNRVRSALQRGGDPNRLIVDIANAAGFWHMGQFARDYRKLFGERPSATLARCSGGVSVLS